MLWNTEFQYSTYRRSTYARKIHIMIDFVFNFLSRWKLVDSWSHPLIRSVDYSCRTRILSYSGYMVMAHGEFHYKVCSFLIPYRDPLSSRSTTSSLDRTNSWRGFCRWKFRAEDYIQFQTYSDPAASFHIWEYGSIRLVTSWSKFTWMERNAVQSTNINRLSAKTCYFWVNTKICDSE